MGAEVLEGDVLKAPFPWFGGKSKVAPLVWQRFGNVRNYVEPFFGSGAVLLGRPQPFAGTETVNDKDGLLCNFWRALQRDPGEVARWADTPVHEAELHARHVWLLERMEALTARLMGDPDYCDVRIAGYWVWGLCCWIGSGWCSGKGCWGVVVDEEGFRQLVHLGDAGRGVNRQLVHLGDAGLGVNRQRVEALTDYFAALAERLARVRVCCGDWKRVCGPTPTVKQGLTGVFLDPPYADTAERTPELYLKDSPDIAHAVREWALAHGDDPKLRIALCGYQGEHDMPPSWACMPWKAKGGYASQGQTKRRGNCRRERIWFSPHCLSPDGQRADAANLFAALPHPSPTE